MTEFIFNKKYNTLHALIYYSYNCNKALPRQDIATLILMPCNGVYI